ncbi:MAG: hypothetical protein ACI841_001287 [Planctomycetota bacterium]|jgi:hypothetical protein
MNSVETKPAARPQNGQTQACWRLGSVLGVSALSALTLPEFGPQTSDLVYAPAASLVLERDLREFTRWNMKSVKRLRGGIDQGDPPVTMDGSNELRLRYHDRFVDIAPAVNGIARPLRIERGIDEIGGNFELTASLAGQHEVQSFEWLSPYDDWDLELQWVPSDEYYRVHRSGEQIEQLELSSRADLSVLLPQQAGNFGVGSQWTMSERGIFDLLRPLGELIIEPKQLAPIPYRVIAPLNMGATSVLSLREFARGLTGKAGVGWTETKETESGDVATLILDFDLDVDSDSTRAFGRLIAATGVDPARDELTMRSTGKLRGKGKVYWDLARGHARSMSLRFDFDLNVNLSWYEETGAGQVDMRVEAAVDGQSELRWTLTAKD